MAYDLEEQESIDQMKAWWEKWGTPITAAVCVVCLGFAGYNGWSWYKRNEAAKASASYMQLQNAVVTHDVKNVASLSDLIINDYSSTVYAPLAAFASAQAALEAEDFDRAEKMLLWVIEKSGREEYDASARIRLAGVYLDAGRIEDGIKVLEGASALAEQQAALDDRLADLYAVKGDFAKARGLWKKVLASGEGASHLRRLVELKLGALPADGLE